MFIKTLAKNQKKEDSVNYLNHHTLPARKQGCFDIPYHQQNLFTDEYWFHKINVMPHIENHRPSMKRRILRVKKEASTCQVRRKNKSEISNLAINSVRNYSSLPSAARNQPRNEHKGQSKFIGIKQSLVRQASEIPEYARNIMKPCKIEAINITQRPASARKISTAGFRPNLTRKGTEKSSLKNQKTQDDLYSNPLLGIFDKRSNKIQPWINNEEDYMY